MTQKESTVFVIHGRNEKIRRSMFSFLRSVGLHPLEWTEVLKKTSKGSPYVGEILENAFSDIQAAIVLMTPDDEAKLRKEFLKSSDPIWEKELTGQARPNVLFEAGMAMGKFPNRTIIVEIGQLRPFSDTFGRHVVRMDDSIGKRQELTIKLESAGCKINKDGQDWYTEGEFVIEESISNKPSETSGQLESECYGLNELAKKCNISIEQLKDVFSIDEEKIEIIKSLQGNSSKKQVIGTICLIVMFKFNFGVDWIKSGILLEALRDSGIYDRSGNFSANLKKYDIFIRSRGKGANKEYKLTTQGRQKGFEIISNLVKDIEVIL